MNEIASLSENLVPAEEAAIAAAESGNLKEAQNQVFGFGADTVLVKSQRRFQLKRLHI